MLFCVKIFPWSAGAGFINHKHQRMDPLTLWRYACLLSSVKSKGGGGGDFPRARRHMHLAADSAENTSFASESLLSGLY